MKAKHSTKPTYSFTTMQEGREHAYQVVQIYPEYRLLEGGYGRSRRDAAESARAAIRQLESGTHYTQQATPNPGWQDCIPAPAYFAPLPMIPADPSYFPF